MSTTTMLQLVQQVTNELGVATPSTVAGNTNQDVIQILALMNASGYELMRRADWRELTKQHTFYTEATSTTGTWTTAAYTITGIPSTAGLSTAYQVQGVGIPNATYVESVDNATTVTLNYKPTEAQVGGSVLFQKVKYSLPSDYYSTVNRTHWDKSKRWEMLGPESPQQWEWLLSGYISTGPRIRWRLLGQYFQIWPGMNAGELLGFEYRSNGWANSASGTPKTSFTADTDTCIYPDRVMVLSTKLKYFEAKGFDTTALYRDYLQELETAIGQDMAAANLSFAPRPGTVLIGYDNIPDSGYGTESQ
jgi:hypothetical protein